MTTFIDPSRETPLFTAQQVSCAYPISDTYGNCPRYLYYSLLVGCLLIRWHPWLSDAFLGAAATYAGVAAFEAFILLARWPKTREMAYVSIPYVSPTSVPGNSTLEALTNLVTNGTSVKVQPGVMEYDVDAILAIVVTGYLFMLPVHCWSTHVKKHRARHLVMGFWNVLMLCATICALILFIRLDLVPTQYRFCYPDFPDLDTITNDGWISSLWQDNWNSTIWNAFADPPIYNTLTENCLYPCFNTSQILRRSQSIVATVQTKASPRTNELLSESQYAHYTYLVFFMYVAIGVSASTAVIVLVLATTGLHRLFFIPIHQPLLFWTDRVQIRENIVFEIKNLTRRRKKRQTLPSSEKEPAAVSTTDTDEQTNRRRSLIRLIGNLFAFCVLVIVAIVIPATWVVFIVWIEWWIHRDLVSGETPQQIGQWAPAVSVGLLTVSALILQLKYRLASRKEVDEEIRHLRGRLEELEGLRDKMA